MTPPAGTLLHRTRKIVLVVCVVLWVAAFAITHTPRDKLPGNDLPDNDLHPVGFFGLGVAFWMTLAAYRVPLARRTILVIGVLAAYAAFDEITQPLASRTADAMDWVLDLIGAVAAALVCGMGAMLARARRARAAARMRK